MEFFDKLKAMLDTLTKKQFYTYVFGGLAAFLFLLLVIMFYCYRSSKSLVKQIDDLNKVRAEVKTILIKKELIKKQKEKMDALIAQAPDFVLGGFLEDDVLPKLGLNDKADRKQSKTVSVDDNYNESIIDMTLSDINMKQLVEFLDAIEISRRVYVKKLEITKSKTTLEVNVSLAALVPKQT